MTDHPTQLRNLIHSKFQTDIESAAVCEGAAVEIEKLRAVLKGYEQWEADVIMDDNCWRDSPMVLSEKQYNRLIELQQLRNAALGDLSNG